MSCVLPFSAFVPFDCAARTEFIRPCNWPAPSQSIRAFCDVLHAEDVQAPQAPLMMPISVHCSCLFLTTRAYTTKGCQTRITTGCTPVEPVLSMAESDREMLRSLRSTTANTSALCLTQLCPAAITGLLSCSLLHY